MCEGTYGICLTLSSKIESKFQNGIAVPVKIKSWASSLKSTKISLTMIVPTGNINPQYNIVFCVIFEMVGVTFANSTMVLDRTFD